MCIWVVLLLIGEVYKFFDWFFEDCYSDFGCLLMCSDECGQWFLVWFKEDWLWFVGQGVFVEGDCLFFDEFDFEMGVMMCFYQLQDFFYECLMDVVDLFDGL